MPSRWWLAAELPPRRIRTSFSSLLGTDVATKTLGGGRLPMVHPHFVVAPPPPSSGPQAIPWGEGSMGWMEAPGAGPASRCCWFAPESPDPSKAPTVCGACREKAKNGAHFQVLYGLVRASFSGEQGRHWKQWITAFSLQLWGFYLFFAFVSKAGSGYVA